MLFYDGPGENKLTCQTSQILHFTKQIMNNLEENFAEIHLPDRQFYLPHAAGQ